MVEIQDQEIGNSTNYTDSAVHLESQENQSSESNKTQIDELVE
jgi:hypothetical protein